ADTNARGAREDVVELVADRMAVARLLLSRFETVRVAEEIRRVDEADLAELVRGERKPGCDVDEGFHGRVIAVRVVEAIGVATGRRPAAGPADVSRSGFRESLPRARRAVYPQWTRRGATEEARMTVDLWMLVAATVLCLLIPFVSLAGLMQTPGGTTWGFGNRDTPLEVALWVNR